MPEETQERRSQRLTVAATPTEEKAAKFVAVVLDVEEGVSGLLRIKSLNEIMAEYEVLRSKIGAPSEAA